MEHLQESRLEEIVLTGNPPTGPESAHIAACDDCAGRMAALELLQAELAIARQSAPAPAQLQRYAALFEQIPRQPAADRLSGWLERVRLALTLDSRHSAPALGLRRAAGFGHRLLYSSALADVELLLEPEGELWQIEGDILPIDAESITPPYLIEIFLPEGANSAEAAPRFQTESEDSGRFRLADVETGRFSLLITPAAGPLIEIVGLEIP